MIDVRRDVPESGKTLTIVLGLAVVLCVVWVLGNAITADAFRGVILAGRTESFLWSDPNLREKGVRG